MCWQIWDKQMCDRGLTNITLLCQHVKLWTYVKIKDKTWSFSTQKRGDRWGSIGKSDESNTILSNSWSCVILSSRVWRSEIAMYCGVYAFLYRRVHHHILNTQQQNNLLRYGSKTLPTPKQRLKNISQWDIFVKD